MRTLPNLLSLFRIAVVPVLVYLLMFPDPVSGVLSALLFLIASVTDYLDGYLARRHRTVSNLGKILDPIADKLLILTTRIMLAAIERPGEPGVPAWLVAVIVAREVAVTVIRGLALAEGFVMAAEELGKYKFILQSFAITGLLLHYSYFGIDFYLGGMYFLWVSTVVALWSGFNYSLQFVSLIQGKPRPVG